MTDPETLVRREVAATIDRAGFDSLDPAAIDVEVTDAFGRKLGECRSLGGAAGYRLRIAARLFGDGSDDQWRDTVRHEVAHAHVFETVGADSRPHGPEWKAAARRAGADPTARYEGDALVDADYALACPNGCFERGYLKRSKRIKTPWNYACSKCGSRSISYDAAARPPDPEPGVCYVESLPWRTARETE